MELRLYITSESKNPAALFYKRGHFKGQKQTFKRINCAFHIMICKGFPDFERSSVFPVGTSHTILEIQKKKSKFLSGIVLIVTKILIKPIEYCFALRRRWVIRYHFVDGNTSQTDTVTWLPDPALCSYNDRDFPKVFFRQNPSSEILLL